ncbi:hypothetical protein KUCAC02_034902 [Chaenocephalus aceratus]|nr:hypothetical protein KUCAC02_034902 [Chaenocephalus aceratus]
MVDVCAIQQHREAPQREEEQAVRDDDMLSARRRDLSWSPTLNRDPIIIPLLTKKASWPPRDVLQLQNKVQLNNPSPLSFSSPPPSHSACCRSRNPLNLCTKSPSSRAHLTVAAADEHPEEMDELEHRGVGLQEICFPLL